METNEQAQAEQGQAQESKPEFNHDALMEKVRAEVKSELDGLNRKIGELTREKQEIAEAAKKEAEAKMTVSERLAKIENDLVASRKEAEAEKHKATMTKIAMEMLDKANLPSSVIRKIDLTNEETVVDDIEYYMGLFNGLEQNAKDETRKKFAFTPGDGEAVKHVPKSLRDCKTKEEKIAYMKSLRNK